MNEEQETYWNQTVPGSLGLLLVASLLVPVFVSGVRKTIDAENKTKDKVVKIITYPDDIKPDELANLSEEADSLARKGRVEVNKIIGDKSDTLSIEFKTPGDGFVKGPNGKYILRLRDTPK